MLLDCSLKIYIHSIFRVWMYNAIHAFWRHSSLEQVIVKIIYRAWMFSFDGFLQEMFCASRMNGSTVLCFVSQTHLNQEKSRASCLTAFLKIQVYCVNQDIVTCSLIPPNNIYSFVGIIFFFWRRMYSYDSSLSYLSMFLLILLLFITVWINLPSMDIQCYRS